jgi:hypothetical protein
MEDWALLGISAPIALNPAHRVVPEAAFGTGDRRLAAASAFEWRSVGEIEILEPFR